MVVFVTKVTTLRVVTRVDLLPWLLVLLLIVWLPRLPLKPRLPILNANKPDVFRFANISYLFYGNLATVNDLDYRMSDGCSKPDLSAFICFFFI
jgi:hypothetical protein